MNYLQRKKTALMRGVGFRGYLRTGSGTLTYCLNDYPVTVTAEGNTVQNGTSSFDTPAEIIGCGDKTKNLLNPNAPHEQGVVDGNGVISPLPDWPFVYTYTIEVKPNTTYVYRTVITNNYTYHFYDKDMNYLYRQGGNVSSVQTITFTTTSDTAYVKITSSMDYVEAQKTNHGIITLNEGDTLADDPYGYKIPVTYEYEPYSEPCMYNIYSPEPLNKTPSLTDSVKINVADKTAVFEKKTDMHVFDGSESWQAMGTDYSDSWTDTGKANTNGFRVFRYYLKYNTTSWGNENVKCSHFTPHADGIIFNSDLNIEGVTKLNGVLYIATDRFGNVAELKEWIAEQYANGTPLTVVYELTPAAYESRDISYMYAFEEFPKLQKGTVTVTAGSEIPPSDILTEYYSSRKESESV